MPVSEGSWQFGDLRHFDFQRFKIPNEYILLKIQCFYNRIIASQMSTTYLKTTTSWRNSVGSSCLYDYHYISALSAFLVCEGDTCWRYASYPHWSGIHDLPVISRAWSFPCYFCILWHASVAKCRRDMENSKLCICNNSSVAITFFSLDYTATIWGFCSSFLQAFMSFSGLWHVVHFNLTLEWSMLVHFKSFGWQFSVLLC